MLRTRIFLNLLPFVLLLLGVGAFAIVLFSHLANRIDATVTGNYRNILVAQAMRLELTGMEREAWVTSAGGDAPTPALKDAEQRFESNLTLLTNGVPPPGTGALHLKLAKQFDAFKKSVAAFNTDGTATERRQTYQLKITPTVLAIDGALEEIRNLNDQAILATRDSVSRITREITRPMIIGMGVALVLAAYAFVRLSRSILAPIQSLTAATRELSEGMWNKPVPIASHDELGELAVAFNTMAAQLQEYRRNTSDELVRLHRAMETTLASFPDPIFVLNKVGQIELKNPSATDFAAALNLEGKLPRRLQAMAKSVLANGKSYLPHSFDAVVSYRIGSAEKFFLPRVVTMPDQGGALFGVAVVLYDVTRFRLLDAAKTNLVATVSHELKTPLTGVLMSLHILLEKTVGALQPRQEELLQTARNDAERLLKILNDLLDLARLEEGITELHRQPAAPEELLQAVVGQTADAAAEKELRIQCKVDPELPTVSVDRQRINHVFSNLVTNAIKYSPPQGEVVLRATRHPEDGVEFSVSDQGQGIAEEYQPRIFDRFYRVPGQEKTGAGLGLSIAREITVAHGGRIGLKSSPGQGTTFVVILPTAAKVR
jgi:NtrC-family two-component system sensor histidine kinase KinB